MLTWKNESSPGDKPRELKMKNKCVGSGDLHGRILKHEHRLLLTQAGAGTRNRGGRRQARPDKHALIMGQSWHLLNR